MARTVKVNITLEPKHIDKLKEKSLELYGTERKKSTYIQKLIDDDK